MQTIATVFIVAALVLCSPARAADPAEEDPAAPSWRAGLELFGKKKYREAMAEFEWGYQLSHRPGFLFNMAECARLLGDKQYAQGLYRRYLIEHPNGKFRREAQQRCRELGSGPCAPQEMVAPVSKPATEQGTPGRFLPTSGTPQPVPPTRTPFYKRWPFWVSIGAAVLAGSVAAAVLASRPGRSTPAGDDIVEVKP